MAVKKVRDLDEAMDPRLSPAQMTLDDARSELSNAVYAATEIIERLEAAALIAGNGITDGGHELYPSIEEMCAANGVALEEARTR